jgi:mannose-6-phosphate isomerase-like protein (cupin superfamily)
MKGYIGDIEKETETNENFRKVLYTSKRMQLVVMSIEPGDEIGEEVHDLDQFIRIEKGKGVVVLNNEKKNIENDYGVIIPAGVKHNVINSGEKPLKLYTIYSPPEHRDGVVHKTREEAMDDEEHFEGKTTE